MMVGVKLARGDDVCIPNTMFLFSRAGQGIWDLLATKE